MNQLLVSVGVQVAAKLKQSSTTAKIRDPPPKTKIQGGPLPAISGVMGPYEYYQYIPCKRATGLYQTVKGL